MDTDQSGFVFDPANLLSSSKKTPTRKELEDVRGMAALLSKQATTGPVRHWAQGLGSMAEALAAKSMIRNAADRERDLLAVTHPEQKFLRVGGAPTGAGGGGRRAEADSDQPIQTAGLGGIGISEMGETGIAGSAGQGQIADDTGGTKSYGVLGLNSGSGSAASFARSYPHLGLTAKPGSAEFDNQWRMLASARPQDLYDAQVDWHKNNIIAPMREGMIKSGVRPEIADDPRVQNYLSDRRVQMGNVGWPVAMQLAQTAGSPEEYIKAVSDNDRTNMGSYFRTYLGEHPERTRGLGNRIALRENMSLASSGGGASPEPVPATPIASATPMAYAPEEGTKVASLAPFAPQDSKLPQANVNTEGSGTVIGKPVTEEAIQVAQALDPKIARRQAADSSYNGPPIPESMYPLRPMYQAADVKRAMQSDMDPVERQALMQEYRNQWQPYDMKVPGGVVRISPDGTKNYIADIQTETIKEAGGSEVQRRFRIMYDQNGIPRKEYLPGDESVIPSPVPTSGDGGIKSFESIIEKTGSGIDTIKPEQPPNQGTPPKPRSELPEGAAPQANQMTGQVEIPSENASFNVAGLKGPPSDVEGPQTAMAGPASNLAGLLAAQPPTSEEPQNAQYNTITNSELRDRMRAREYDRKYREELLKKDADTYVKTMDGLENSSRDSRSVIPTLELARDAVNSGKMNQGPGVDFKNFMAKVKSFLNIDPTATTTNEVFEKAMAGTILKNLRTETQGMGQIRVKEVEIIEAAAANKYNTQAANRVVLDMMIRTHRKALELSELGRAYDQGYRFDEKGNAKLTNEAPTRSGLNQTLDNFMRKHPLMTEDDRKTLMYITKNGHLPGEEPSGTVGTKSLPKGATPLGDTLNEDWTYGK